MSAALCRGCGVPLAAGVRFCPQCGVTSSGPLIPSQLGTGTPALPTPSPPVPVPTPSVGVELDGGRYRITHLLNAGSFGAVYQAQDLRLAGQACAVKELLHPAGQSPADQAESAAWFQREAALLMHLRHPMIPRIWDRFTDNGSHYLVMDLIPGHNLEQEMRARGRLPEHEVLEWGMALCTVLQYLHAQQPPIVFRDLKPANIMRTPDGQLHVIDFGIARTLGTAGGTLRPGTMIGTPGYAPLEQYQGMAEPRSDIYALGATLHRLLTGYDPERGQPLTFPPVQELRPDLHVLTEEVLARAVALRPFDRWADAAVFAAELATARAQATSVGPVSASTQSASSSIKQGQSGGQTPRNAQVALSPTSGGASGVVAPVTRRRYPLPWLVGGLAAPGVLAISSAMITHVLPLLLVAAADVLIVLAVLLPSSWRATIGRWLLFIGRWLWFIGRWLLFIGRWLLIAMLVAMLVSLAVRAALAVLGGALSRTANQ